MKTNIDFKTVVPAAQAGKKAAQDALMTHFYAWSVAQAGAYIRDSELAKDVAVDFWTWLFTERGINEYRADKGSFYSWMKNRIIYRALDATQKRRPNLIYYSAVSDPTSWDVDPETGVMAQQDLTEIDAALPTKAHRDVFWQIMEGATPKEIASGLGVSIKRARNLIGEVRAVIREQRAG